MQKLLSLLSLFLISSITFAQEHAGQVFVASPIYSASLYKKNAATVGLNGFFNESNQWQNNFSLQGAYSPFNHIAVMGAFYRDIDKRIQFGADIRQKLNVFETAVGLYRPKYTTPDQQRIKVWDLYAGMNWGSGEDHRIFAPGSNVDLPFNEGYTDLSADFYTHFAQVGFHYILDMKIHLKFGGSARLNRSKVYYLKYRSNFKSQNFDNLVSWNLQIASDFSIGYKGFLFHLQINMIQHLAPESIHFNTQLGNNGLDENYFQVGIEKVF